MSKDNLDVVAVGNAIVDVLTQVEDRFITDNGLNKGAMTLIETSQAEALYAKMGQSVEMSGGSAANTIAGIASLGGKVGYIGKVAADQLGNVFSHDIRATGVAYGTPPLMSGAPTARCLILITPDAQRTMCTFLGASVLLGKSDLDLDMIRGAQVTYLEGYLFDRDQAKAAFRMAAEAAHAAGKKVALTLSDPFCVDRHRAEFQDLVKNHVDILFANEAEILSLYKANKFEDAIAAVKPYCEVAAITRGAQGSVVIGRDVVHEVRAEPVAKVVDTTGAGDLYAAGFLYGYTRGKDLAASGQIGSIAAAEIIGQIGARPMRKLQKVLLEKNAA